MLHINDKGKINNSEYQELNGISKATATRDLTKLVENYKLLKRSGEVDAGTNYVLIGSFYHTAKKKRQGQLFDFMLYNILNFHQIDI